MKMTVRPTVEKVDKMKRAIVELVEKRDVKIREIAGLIGLMVDYTKETEYGKGHYRHLEQEEIRALA